MLKGEDFPGENPANKIVAPPFGFKRQSIQI